MHTDHRANRRYQHSNFCTLRSLHLPFPILHSPLRIPNSQFFIDLITFRDDAHITAWQAYGVGGRSWEAFTLIWRDQANSPADLTEKLSQRGYSELLINLQHSLQQTETIPLPA